MSAFAVVFDIANSPVDPAVLEHLMARLAHRGPDGNDVLVRGFFAMGHWHFWTTPEECGERQPLQLPGMPFWLVFDGRLDNRPELLRGLGLDDLDSASWSDASLVLHAYGRWGRDCFPRFIGEYALALLDQPRRELVCARDALGDRSLFYAHCGTRLVVASEPSAVAGADGLAVELNETALVHYFALQASEEGQTLFKNVYELPPGHVMAVSAARTELWRTWQPDGSSRLHGLSDREYADGFMALLEESVRCRMRSIRPPAILMSGGLDSSSVACLAARQSAPGPLTTLSYVFDELPDCDERGYIAAMQRKWGIRSIQVACDDLWPYKNLADWPHDPNRPDGNPYRMVLERTYARARQENLQVLLTGTYGDELYDGEENWLADLVADGRARDIWPEMGLHLRYLGLLRTWKMGFVQRLVHSLLRSMPGGSRLLALRRRPGRYVPAWLTPFSAGCLPVEKPQGDPLLESRNILLGSWTAADCVNEIPFASRYGLELRHPYRDRRLVEYVLSLPAHQLYYHGQYKYVLRTAMQGILPEIIRTRPAPTTLLSLFARGVEREKHGLQPYFQDSHAPWCKYVRLEWLTPRWDLPVTRQNDGADKVVPWLCVSFSSWLEQTDFCSTIAP